MGDVPVALQLCGILQRRKRRNMPHGAEWYRIWRERSFTVVFSISACIDVVSDEDLHHRHYTDHQGRTTGSMTDRFQYYAGHAAGLECIVLPVYVHARSFPTYSSFRHTN